MVKNGFVEELGFDRLKSISFGFVASLFLLWLLFNSNSFVPEGQELKYTLAFLGYGLLGSYTFAREDVKARLNEISFIKAFPIFSGVMIASFIGISSFLGLQSTPDSVLYALVGIPIYLQALNSFVFALVETSFFQVIIQEKEGLFLSALMGGFFHMLVWNGTALANFIGASILFFVFGLVYYFAKRRFGIPVALIITIAFHSGYNLAKYRGVFGV